jgi:hypothetical protein
MNLYECHACGGLFTERHDACPACGGRHGHNDQGGAAFRRISADEFLALIDG